MSAFPLELRPVLGPRGREYLDIYSDDSEEEDVHPASVKTKKPDQEAKYPDSPPRPGKRPRTTFDHPQKDPVDYAADDAGLEFVTNTGRAIQRIAEATTANNEYLRKMAFDSDRLVRFAYDENQARRGAAPAQAPVSPAVATPPPSGTMRHTLTTLRDQALFKFLKHVARVAFPSMTTDGLFDWRSYHNAMDVNASDAVWTNELVLPHLQMIRFATHFALVFLQHRLNAGGLLLPHLIQSHTNRTCFAILVVDVYTSVKVNTGFKYSPVHTLQIEEQAIRQVVNYFQNRHVFLTKPDELLAPFDVTFVPWTHSNRDIYGDHPQYAALLQLCSESTFVKFDHPKPDTSNPDISPLALLEANASGYAFEPSLNMAFGILMSRSRKRTTASALFNYIINTPSVLLIFIGWLSCHYYISKQQQKTSDARKDVTERNLRICNAYAQWCIQHV